MSAEHHKAVVRRLVPDVFNRGQLELLDELYDPSLAGRAKAWIGPFRNSFTDLEMEIVDLVAEGQWPPGSSAPEPIPARLGHPPTGQQFRRVPEVYFFEFH